MPKSESYLRASMNAPIPDITPDEYASVTAQAARLARGTGLGRSEAVDLLRMLGMDQADFVQRSFDRHGVAIPAA